jgi:hypothetical protein
MFEDHHHDLVEGVRKEEGRKREIEQLHVDLRDSFGAG